jgi:hypothetical protein
MKRSSSLGKGPDGTKPEDRGGRPVLLYQKNAQIILMDASWDQNKRAGITYTRFGRNGTLMEIYYKAFRAEEPFCAEANAVLKVIQN